MSSGSIGSGDATTRSSSTDSLMAAPKDGTSRLKWIFLGWYGACACLQPFLPIYYKRHHVSSQQIGLLTSLNPFISIVASPLVALISDYTQKPTLITSLCVIISTLLRAFILFVGRSTSDIIKIFEGEQKPMEEVSSRVSVSEQRE